MDELKTSIKVLLANATVLYYKAHQFHWNVEGVHFTQYHSFFEELYTDVYESIDPTAELLRKLDDYPPVSIDALYKFKTIEEEDERKVKLSEILASLISANQQVIDSLNKVFEISNKNKQQGVCNFIADRIDKHQKHAWWLKSSAKTLG
jgi:starvation-inducible DNA-binding protein